MSDYETLVIAIRESFISPQIKAQLQEELCDLWEAAPTAANLDHYWNGWLTNYHKEGSPEQAWWVYQVTTRQCKRDKLYAFTQADRTALSNQINSNNPNIWAKFSHDAEGWLAEWGVVKNPTEEAA